jgi:hypothetical protein
MPFRAVTDRSFGRNRKGQLPYPDVMFVPCLTTPGTTDDTQLWPVRTGVTKTDSQHMTLVVHVSLLRRRLKCTAYTNDTVSADGDSSDPGLVH